MWGMLVGGLEASDMSAYGCETGNINAGEEGGDAGGGFVYVVEPIEARVGDGNAGLFRVYSGIGKVGGLAEIWAGSGSRLACIAMTGQEEEIAHRFRRGR